jgi:hypothetical protein
MKINNHDARCIDWYRRLTADGTAEDGQRIAVDMHDQLAEVERELETLRSENAMLRRQRAPEHRSELEDVDLTEQSREIARISKANMDEVLRVMGLE